MGRTLFVGCSHTMGFYDPGSEIYGTKTWQDNNYAEFYSEIYNKPVVIMASAGAGNRAFPRFISYAFDLYNDIDEVFVQSTYWGRFPVAMNPTLDNKNIYPIDFFIEKQKSDKNIDRYDIGLYQGDHVEYYLKPKARDYDDFPYMKDTKPFISEPDVRRTSHLYMQMWHHSNTHLEQEDYFMNMAVCDTICAKNNANLYIWNINNRCYIPKETKNYYTKLNAKIAPIDAESYLKKELEIDTIDGEHYSTNVHRAIAERYIPYIKDKSW